MTVKEVRNIVSSSSFSEELKNFTFKSKFEYQNKELELQGFTNIYDFFYTQKKGWENFDEQILIEGFFKANFFFFEDRYKSLLTIVKGLVSQNHINLRNSLTDWQKHTRLSNHFSFDSATTNFLKDLKVNNSQYLSGAIAFVKKESIPQGHNSAIGYLTAYEFHLKDVSGIYSRSKKERTNLRRLESDFIKKTNTAEQTLTEYLTESKNNYKEYTEATDIQKQAVDKTLDDWVKKNKHRIQQYENGVKSKIEDLETLYGEKLRLKKPAEFWRTRAKKLKKQGWISISVLVFLVFVASVSLYFLLWQTPEGMLTAFSEDPASAIRWSIIFVTFISFLAYGIRVLNKVSFSAFHLSRDAEEREQLTYLYLSLRDEKSIDEKDRQLILQSLFSRADTGLLKEDSSPTMPGGMDLSKLFK